jgi:hypothetical protein
MLRSSQSFSSYNFREYFIQRTKDSFREIQVRSLLLPIFFVSFSCPDEPCPPSPLNANVLLDTYSTHPRLLKQQAESDPTRLSTLYAAAQRESGVIRRSAIVNQLYGGPKLAVELQDKEVEAREMEGHALETGLERGNN